MIVEGCWVFWDFVGSCFGRLANCASEVKRSYDWEDEEDIRVSVGWRGDELCVIFIHHLYLILGEVQLLICFPLIPQVALSLEPLLSDSSQLW